MEVVTPEERVGTLLANKYRLDKIIGRGGMGVVLAATHTWTDRAVAVKLLHYEAAADPAVAQRFLQEAKAAGTLRHPNVVDVLDMGMDADGSVYLVLEMLEGQSLATRIEEGGPLTLSEAIAFLLPVMDALELAHSKGTVHRDLKPENIFLSHDGAGRIVPKVLDFGIAKRSDATALGVKTATGQLLGTPWYMSPEQARGAPDVGPQSDVWSMGVVWFQVLTGKLPFDADSLGALLFKLMTETAPPIRDLVPTVPASIASAIDASMLADRAARHASMAVFASALRAAALAEGIEAPLASVTDPAAARNVPSKPPMAFAATATPLPSASPMAAVTPKASVPPPPKTATAVLDAEVEKTSDDAKDAAVPIETMSAVARKSMSTGANLEARTKASARRPVWPIAALLGVAVLGGSALLKRKTTPDAVATAPNGVTAQRRSLPSAMSTVEPPRASPPSATAQPPAPVAPPTPPVAPTTASAAAPAANLAGGLIEPAATTAASDAGAAHSRTRGHSTRTQDPVAGTDTSPAEHTATRPAERPATTTRGNGEGRPAEIRNEF